MQKHNAIAKQQTEKISKIVNLLSCHVTDHLFCKRMHDVQNHI